MASTIKMTLTLSCDKVKSENLQTRGYLNLAELSSASVTNKETENGWSFVDKGNRLEITAISKYDG